MLCFPSQWSHQWTIRALISAESDDVLSVSSDWDAKFKVKVYDDYLPREGFYVSFNLDWGNYKENATNSDEEVYFPLNYKVGKYYAETYIESKVGRSYWSADNTVTIKSTISAKESYESIGFFSFF